MRVINFRSGCHLSVIHGGGVQTAETKGEVVKSIKYADTVPSWVAISRHIILSNVFREPQLLL